MSFRSHVAVLAGLLLTACASDPPQDGGPAAPPPPVTLGGGCGRLFVSPAGEPFRTDSVAPDAPCPIHTWFAAADANGDGVLTRTEFRNDALRFFAVLDADGNGFIDGAELKAYESRVVPEILGRGGGPRASLEAHGRWLPVALQMGGMGGMGGGGMGGGGRGGRGQDGPPPSAGASPHSRLEEGAGLARMGLLDEPEPVAAADLNFDGRITRVEFATRADQRFASLDEAEAGGLPYALLAGRMQERARRHGGNGPSAGPRRGSGGSGNRHGRGAAPQA